MEFDYRTSTGLEKQILEGHKQNLVCTRSQEKEAVSPQETEPDLPVSVQQFLVEAWLDNGLLWGQGTEYNSTGISPFEGGPHYPHYPYHSLASGQTTRREHNPAHQQKIGLSDLLSMAPPIKTRPSFPHSQSIP